MSIAEFIKVDEGVWESVNCANANIKITERELSSGSDEKFFAKIDGATFSNFGRTWDVLIRELECSFAWSVKIT